MTLRFGFDFEMYDDLQIYVAVYRGGRLVGQNWVRTFEEGRAWAEAVHGLPSIHAHREVS